MNDLRSLADVGRGNQLIAAYFSSSGCMPSDEIMCLAKLILLLPGDGDVVFSASSQDNARSLH